MIDLIAASTDICIGTSCALSTVENTVTETPKPGVFEMVQQVANTVFPPIMEAARPYTPVISACAGGLFLANGGIHLAKPQASGAWVLTNFIASAILAGVAINNEQYDDTLLYSVFWGSALLMAINRIKTLENQCAAVTEIE